MLLPCHGGRTHQGMQQRQTPKPEKHRQLPTRSMGQPDGNQAVGPQIADAAQTQTCDGLNIESFDEPVHARRDAAELASLPTQMLAATLDHEQDGPCCHHGAADQPA